MRLVKMAFTPFKFEQRFVTDFIRDYESGLLIKPRLQRKLAWTRVEMTKYHRLPIERKAEA